jgi:hypothetical protein
MPRVRAGKAYRSRRAYGYLVETARDPGKLRQRIIAKLGRKGDAAVRGDLDRLARSAAHPAQRSTAVSLADADAVPQLGCRGIGRRGLIKLSPAA